ncbi:MAG: hypothetical protein J6Y78_04260 [Paludibacteraceae bacterium]|nr:hypothetical protein [Paludibacteraceae bacterium]
MDDVKRIEKELNDIRQQYVDLMSIESHQIMLMIDFNQLANQVNDLKYALRIAKAKSK